MSDVEALLDTIKRKQKAWHQAAKARDELMDQVRIAKGSINARDPRTERRYYQLENELENADIKQRELAESIVQMLLTVFDDRMREATAARNEALEAVIDSFNHTLELIKDYKAARQAVSDLPAEVNSWAHWAEMGSEPKRPIPFKSGWLRTMGVAPENDSEFVAAFLNRLNAILGVGGGPVDVADFKRYRRPRRVEEVA